MTPTQVPTRAEYGEDTEREMTGWRLARVLDYPGEHFVEQLSDTCAILRTEIPSVAAPLLVFLQSVETLTREQREELFTRTFDINPACSLEIGWQLFGEEYHRGALLVRLRSELRRHGIEESTELPDHLTHVLSLLDLMAADEALSFARCCVIPAMDKMLAALDDGDNPYGSLLLAVALYLRHRFVSTTAGE